MTSTKKLTTSTKTLEVHYWIGPVSLLGACYDLITASVDTSSSVTHKSVVYCALREPVSQGHGQHLNDLKQNLRHAGTINLTPEQTANHDTVQQVKAYLAGQRRDFDLCFTLFGTPFQKKVWQELLKIPYGATQCYEDTARAAGNPRGARAVGMANNRNPISLIVPCHRVIGKNGRLVGYGGGLDIKSKLLILEAQYKE